MVSLYPKQQSNSFRRNRSLSDFRGSHEAGFVDIGNKYNTMKKTALKTQGFKSYQLKKKFPLLSVSSNQLLRKQAIKRALSFGLKLNPYLRAASIALDLLDLYQTYVVDTQEYQGEHWFPNGSGWYSEFVCGGYASNWARVSAPACLDGQALTAKDFSENPLSTAKFLATIKPSSIAGRWKIVEQFLRDNTGVTTWDSEPVYSGSSETYFLPASNPNQGLVPNNLIPTRDKLDAADNSPLSPQRGYSLQPSAKVSLPLRPPRQKQSKAVIFSNNPAAQAMVHRLYDVVVWTFRIRNALTEWGDFTDILYKHWGGNLRNPSEIEKTEYFYQLYQDGYDFPISLDMVYDIIDNDVEDRLIGNAIAELNKGDNWRFKKLNNLMMM